MNLKEVRERHEKDDQLDWGFVQFTGQQAHQDRAYLLGLAEEMKEVLNGINESRLISPVGLSDKIQALRKKLESEAGE
jgi:hypothetical protein